MQEDPGCKSNLTSSKKNLVFLLIRAILCRAAIYGNLLFLVSWSYDLGMF